MTPADGEADALRLARRGWTLERSPISYGEGTAQGWRATQQHD